MLLVTLAKKQFYLTNVYNDCNSHTATTKDSDDFCEWKWEDMVGRATPDEQ